MVGQQFCYMKCLKEKQVFLAYLLPLQQVDFIVLFVFVLNDKPTG